jgi:hypothetical protein
VKPPKAASAAHEKRIRAEYRKYALLHGTKGATWGHVAGYLLAALDDARRQHAATANASLDGAGEQTPTPQQTPAHPGPKEGGSA